MDPKIRNSLIVMGVSGAAWAMSPKYDTEAGLKIGIFPILGMAVGVGMLSMAFNEMEAKRVAEGNLGNAAIFNPASPDMIVAVEREERPISPVATFMAGSRLIATPVAMAVSYKRNASIGWVLIQGLLFPITFLIYNAINPK